MGLGFSNNWSGSIWFVKRRRWAQNGSWFSVRSDKVFELKQYLNDHFNRSVAEADNVVSLPIDGLITVAAVKEELLELLERLEPFGAGNPEPRFVIPSLQVKYATVVGDQHIKCRFVDKSSGEISGICFRSVGTKNRQRSFKSKRNASACRWQN